MAKKRSQPKRCVFCKEPGSSEEHVFALWLGDVFADSGPFTLEYSDGRKPKRSSRMPIVNRAVCKRCNETWMSAIEAAVRPLIEPVIRGANATWAPPQQNVVATWAFKTALMVDRARHDRHVVWPEHFRHLYEMKVPPPSVQVHLGRYHPGEGDQQLAPGIAVRVGIDQVPGLGLGEDGAYRISFSVGQVIFDVRGFPGINNVDLRPVRFAGTKSGLVVPMAGSFSELWPRGGSSFTWPPSGSVLDTTSLKAFLA